MNHRPISAATIGAVLFVFGQSLPVAASSEAFGEKVRGYLLSHPQVILEVFEILEAQEGKAALERDRQVVRENAAALFNAASPWFGAEDAGEVLVQFSDYRCGYCKANAPILKDWLEADPSRKLILKELPILGAESREIGETVLAVRELYGDTAYRDLHDLLFGYQGPASSALLGQLIEAAGYDTTLINVSRKSAEVQDELTANAELARALGIEGTPSFAVGEQVLRGFIDEGQLAGLFGG